MELEERRYGATTVLFGAGGGKYPSGNSLVVRGAEEALVIDPSLGLVARADPPRVDRVLNSHCHEDHIAGNFLFPDLPLHIHEHDRHGLDSLDAMMEIYGYPEPIHGVFRKAVSESFHYAPRPDAIGFRDGDVFELGGGVRLRVIHAPGHTRGHSLFHVEPDDLVYLGDIDLSSFGPYYGDAWSDLEDFERTLSWVRDLDVRYYATFHHVGVLEGRAAFLERFERFEAKIAERERSLLDYLRELHTLDEIAAHRFVFRPGDQVSFAEAVERRSMAMHLARLENSGRVERRGEAWIAAA